MNAVLEPLLKEEHPSLQDRFIEELTKAKTPVAIYLINGIRLVGSIEGFDPFTVMLSNNGLQQLVYKHVIATVVPGDTQRHVPHSGSEADGNYKRREERRSRQSSSY